MNFGDTDQTVPKAIDTEQTVPKAVDTEQTVPKAVNTKQTVPKTVEANQTVPKTVEQRTPVSPVISPTQTGMTGLNFARQPVPNGKHSIVIVCRQPVVNTLL